MLSGVFYWCRGFCHGTESDLFLYLFLSVIFMIDMYKELTIIMRFTIQLQKGSK